MHQQPQQTQQYAQPWPGYASGQATQQKKTGRGLAAGVAALALVCGLVGGGVGGFVGYQLGGDSSTGASALDESKPARSASTAPQGSVQQVAQKVLPSVVQIQISSAQGSGEGSGIVLSSDGLILTNNHVAEGAQSGRLTALFHDNRTAPVRVVGTDPKSDLAVVKADITGLTPAELGRSDDLPVGSQVVAIGSPFGLSGTVTSGIISAKDRPVRAGGESGSQDTVLNALQTDAAINPGNSGGPLVDMDGRVVGINSAIYSPGSGQEQAGSVGLGFAIPIDQARRIANELKETGSATQTTLGVTITNANQPGAQVRDVIPNGPAQAAGIKPGDVITKIDDRAILDADALVAAVRSHNPGDRVRFTIGGPGGERTVDVTLTGQKG
ncbi:PDZ domain-containing protein [Saccharopolyspora karakumensis]|uniref:PDZ domain-containing protein n=2 Tax=Saccharopolyspora karakumensis TaxID=2530386 RepID=A0A4R5C1C0_9PSEU|nr:PDZ domain-containing protein [Saccharopolyspora karakumensis]